MNLPREKSNGGRIPFVIYLRKVKYLEIDITKTLKDLYNEKFKTPRREF